jgi:hypothetical protein
MKHIVVPFSILSNARARCQVTSVEIKEQKYKLNSLSPTIVNLTT